MSCPISERVTTNINGFKTNVSKVSNINGFNTNVSKVSNINGFKQMLVSKVFELGRSPGLVVMG